MQLVTEDNITDLAVERWATAKDPRLAEILTSLVRHLHGFAREVRLTEAEWMAAIQWLNRTGQISDEKRQEFILASDVLGLSMLVVQMNHRLDPDATPNTVLGPFHIDGSPPLPFGADMSDGVAGTPLFVHGTVRDLSGAPVGGALLDVWQADGDGMYEAQLEVDEARLRAKYSSREDGSYCVRTVAPLGYAIPMDGPVGELVGATADQPLPARPRALPHRRAGLRAAHHAPVPGGRGVPGQRRRVRHQGGARRRVRAAGAGTDPGRRRHRRPVALGGVRLRAPTPRRLTAVPPKMSVGAPSLRGVRTTRAEAREETHDGHRL